jgi:hypothetical protein
MKILLYFLLLLSNALLAQVPGYLGKRIYMMASYHIGIPHVVLPGSVESVPLNTSDDRVYYAVNTPRFLNFKLSYVVSDHSDLELSLRNIKTGITQRFDYKYFPSSTYNNKTEFGVLQLQDQALGISIKKTVNGGISPLGKYILAGFSYNMISLTDPNHIYRTKGIVFTDYKTGFLDLHLGVGSNSIIADQFLVNLSVESYLNDYIFIGTKDETLEWKKAIKGRILSDNYFMFSVGLGYLIF